MTGSTIASFDKYMSEGSAYEIYIASYPFSSLEIRMNYSFQASLVVVSPVMAKSLVPQP